MNETKNPREEEKTGKKRAPELKAELYKEIKNIVIEKENKNFNISNKVKELQELLVTNKKNLLKKKICLRKKIRCTL